MQVSLWVVYSSLDRDLHICLFLNSILPERVPDHSSTRGILGESHVEITSIRSLLGPEKAGVGPREF